MHWFHFNSRYIVNVFKGIYLLKYFVKYVLLILFKLLQLQHHLFTSPLLSMGLGIYIPRKDALAYYTMMFHDGTDMMFQFTSD